MLARDKDKVEKGGIELEQSQAKPHDAERPMVRKVALVAASCYVVFAGLWFTWIPLLLSRVITSPGELQKLKGVEALVFVGLTGIIIYFAVRISTSKIIEIRMRLQRSEEDLLKRLGQAAEWRDDETSDHTVRVGEYCELLAEGLGWDKARCEHVRKAGMLHDIGKIGIPDFVMIKREGLSDEERNLMQAHTLMGSDLLSDSVEPMIQMAQRIATAHHERWDGTGYPYGLSGEGIPIEGRIAAVADVFDALTSRRRYKAAWTFDDAVAEIERSAGSQFDPAVVEVFLSKMDDFKRVHDKYANAARAINVNRAA